MGYIHHTIPYISQATQDIRDSRHSKQARTKGKEDKMNEEKHEMNKYTALACKLVCISLFFFFLSLFLPFYFLVPFADTHAI